MTENRITSSGPERSIRRAKCEGPRVKRHGKDS